ncbi:MAG TPA: cytochrome P450 [Acidimicrobiales bacterium]|nr:cytochrome P450 [Acidimicrobiales bacterium]
MSDFAGTDYFTDPSLVEDPYGYYEHLRAQGPVCREPHQGTYAVTGYDEAVAVYRDDDTFSSCNSVGGPFPGLPVEAEGDDISDLIEAHRHVFPLSDNFATFDPPKHTAYRGLMLRLITPRRLRENEEFMRRMARRHLDSFIDAGRCEFVDDYAHPLSLLVVADFLGVPEEDHARFRRGFDAPKPVGSLEGGTYSGAHVSFLEESFSRYVEDRRRRPRPDALTKLAQATFPDGTLPEVADVVKMASLIFAAGQGTTVHLLGMAMVFLAEHPELQGQLRQHKDRIPDFLEEVLRLESPVKTIFRLARRPTVVGGVDIPAGATVTLMNGAANRDPHRFDRPAELHADRPNAKDHLAFGRGTHACPGGPLSRAEGRISLEVLLDRIGDIRLSEDHHGPAGARHFPFQPSFFSRRIEQLHLQFTPLG